jgi:lambda family phage tail tape measure protein
MADIQVTLVLDDSQYTGKLTQAEKSAESFGDKSAQATKKAKEGFDKLGEGIKGVNEKLKQIMEIKLAEKLLEWTKEGLEFADKLDDMAKAFGLTIPQMLEFQQAIVLAGGSSEAAGRGIATFFTKLDDARQGSGQVQYAFERLGVSMRDLAKMSDQDIMRKALDGLVRLGTGAEQTRLAVEFFGKAFKGIPVDEVNEKLTELKGSFDKYGVAIEQGAKLNKSLEQAFTNLKLATLDVFGPIIKSLGDMNDPQKGLEKAHMIVKGLVIATGAFIGLKFAAALVEIGVAARGAAVGLYAMAAGEAAATGGISILTNIASKLAAMGIGALAAKLGIDMMEESQKKANEEAEKASKVTEKKQEGDKQVLNTSLKLRESILQQVEAFKKAQEAINNKIDTDARSITMSERQTKANAAAVEAQTAINAKITELEGKLAEAKKALPGTDEARNVKTYQNAIDDLKNSMGPMIASRVESTQKAYDSIEATKALTESLTEQANITKQLQQIEDDYAIATLGPLAAKYENVTAAAQRAVEERIAARRADKGITNANATEADLKIEQDMRRQSAENAKKLRDGMKEADDEQRRDWLGGWKKALRDYMEASQDIYGQVNMIGQHFTKGLEDAFVNFAKTGKLSFKDLANTIIEDFIRMEVRMMTSQIFGMFVKGTFGSGSVTVGDLIPGKAAGGFIGAGQPTLVGENGPEIFTPPTGGQVTPNGGAGYTPMGGGDTYHTHNYNIQAVDAKSVAQLFAENRMTMFGMVEQARRELPMRTR